MGVNCFNHAIEREFVFCESIDFHFLKHEKFSFVEKLKNLDCMGLLNVSDEVYP